jgi:hypothetical protein
MANTPKRRRPPRTGGSTQRQFVTCGATNGGATVETDCSAKEVKDCVKLVKDAVGLKT